MNIIERLEEIRVRNLLLSKEITRKEFGYREESINDFIQNSLINIQSDLVTISWALKRKIDSYGD